MDEGRAPKGVVRGVKEEGKVGGGGRISNSGGRYNGSTRREGAGGAEDRRGKTPAEASNWSRVVDLFHMAFAEGRLAEENMWKVVVLIPKGEKEYCDIGLMEVM